MRTLSLVEVEQVSGAGTIADVTNVLGGGIGAVIDAIKYNQNNGTKPDGNKPTPSCISYPPTIDPSGTSQPPVNPNRCKPWWLWLL